MKNPLLIAIAMVLFGAAQRSFAQHQHVDLHVNPRWSQCSFQLDPSLTQSTWREFTSEAGLVAYFRPLTDAKLIGQWKFEVSLLQWSTGIDDSKPAWNDTFVHPDSAHWLKEGHSLPIPGLSARIGITDKMDVAMYWTKSPGANYGFWGGQLQYSLLNNVEKNWSAATRVNFVSIYGPDDLKFQIYGVDVLASREYKIYSNWASIALYVGLSTYLSHAHETSAVVDLKDENVIGIQGMVGAVAKLSVARIGVEYNFAKVSTLSMKVGVAF